MGFESEPVITADMLIADDALIGALTVTDITAEAITGTHYRTATAGRRMEVGTDLSGHADPSNVAFFNGTEDVAGQNGVVGPFTSGTSPALAVIGPRSNARPVAPELDLIAGVAGDATHPPQAALFINGTAMILATDGPTPGVGVTGTLSVSDDVTMSQTLTVAGRADFNGGPTRYIFARLGGSGGISTTEAEWIALTVNVTSTDDVYMVTAVCDITSGGTGVATGTLYVDSTAQSGQAIFFAASSQRATVTQTWMVTGLSAGSHTFHLKGRVTSGSATVNATHTCLTAVRVL